VEAGAETRRKLVEKALREGYSISGEALEALNRLENPLQALRRILNYLREKEPNTLVIEVRHLEELETPPNPEKEPTEYLQEPVLAQIPELQVDERFLKFYRIEGKTEEFKRYFSSRYEKLLKLLQRRGLSFLSTSSVRGIKQGQEAVLSLMLLEKRETRKALILEGEDSSGFIRLIVPKRSQRLFQEASLILPDSVFGARVTRLNDSFLVKELFLPDAPIGGGGKASEAPETYLCLVSDLHVGSRKFRRDLWESFLDWINRGRDPEAKRVRHLVIAGDLVDGVGIFPGQRWELEYTSVKKQLEEAAELLRDIPSHIKIILSPGNHDPVERALPQPPLTGDYRRILEKVRGDIVFVGNPAWIELGGRRILIYHGQSFDDIIQALPNVSYNTLQKDVGNVLESVIRHRHLAPIYGGNTPILPLPEDLLVLEKLPNIIHSGHIHVAYAGTYRDIKLVNTGTWQEQTSYQRSMGLEPTVGTIAIVNLKTLSLKLKKFT